MLAMLLLAPVALAQAPTDGDVEARALFEAGRRAFERGEFEAAHARFQAAHAVSGRPELLFNVGAAAERLGRRDAALEAFRAYLAARPDAANIAEVRGKITALEAEARPGAGVAPPPAALRAPAPRRSGGAGPVITIAVGGALVAGAGVLFGLGAADSASVEAAPDGSRFAEVRAAYDRADTEVTLGAVLASVGLAALGVGIAWAVDLP